MPSRQPWTAASSEGILKDVLIRQKTEVMHMLLTEFDEKKYKRSVYQDGYEDGVREGEISGFSKGEASGLRKGQAQGREDALQDLARKKPPRARTWQLSPRNWRRTWKQWSGS